LKTCVVGRYARPCLIMHEPEASLALYQEDDED